MQEITTRAATSALSRAVGLEMANHARTWRPSVRTAEAPALLGRTRTGPGPGSWSEGGDRPHHHEGSGGPRLPRPLEDATEDASAIEGGREMEVVAERFEPASEYLGEEIGELY